MQMVSSEAMEAAPMASKYRKYECDYLQRINHLYFSGATLDISSNNPPLSPHSILRIFGHSTLSFF